MPTDDLAIPGVRASAGMVLVQMPCYSGSSINVLNLYEMLHICRLIACSNVMIWLVYKEIVKPLAPIFRSLNLVMYFGCQLDEPYGFPGDHQMDATMLLCTHWYLPWISVIVLLLCSIGNKTYYYYNLLVFDIMLLYTDQRTYVTLWNVQPGVAKLWRTFFT